MASLPSVGFQGAGIETDATGYGGFYYVTGEAGFEAEERGESHNAGLGRRRSDFFAGRRRFSIGRAGW